MKNAIMVLIFILSVCAIMLIACTKVVLEANPYVEDQIIVMRACNELDITPQHTVLTVLSVEYLPWAKCDVYNYALEADECVYVVGVQKLGEKVIYVDVIEKVDSVAAAWANYATT